jgi:hypothetical protein
LPRCLQNSKSGPGKMKNRRRGPGKGVKGFQSVYMGQYSCSTLADFVCFHSELCDGILRLIAMFWYVTQRSQALKVEKTATPVFRLENSKEQK